MQQELPFTDIGQGSDLVLFHGLGGDRQQWLDLLPPALPFRTLVPDLPGHGQAGWLPLAGCSFASFADAAYQWLFTEPKSPVSSEPVVLGGISMGAGVAVRLALLAPERVSKLILIRPAWLNRPMPENLLLLHRLGTVWSHRTTDQTRQWLEQDEQYQALAVQSPACAKSVLGQLSRAQPALAARTLMDMTADSPIISPLEVERLTMPTLVIGSDRDLLHPLSMANTWAEWLPNAHYQQVDSRYDQPEVHRQQVQSLLVDFLQSPVKAK